MAGAADVLTKAAAAYASAKAGQIVGNLGEKVAGTGSPKEKPEGEDQNGEEKKGFVGNTMEKIGEGSSPIGAAVKGLGSTIKEGVKGLFKRKGGSKRPTNIVEDCFVGVTPEVAFAAWTQFEEFASFMKGVENVARGEEVPEEDLEEGQDPHEGEEMQWTGKIFINRRTWKSTTVDYDEPHRISWKTEGPKGTIDGTMTFTPIGDNATLMLLVLEYRPKGLIEWIGNRWRTVGRRARLDLKHFKRYVMRTEPEDLPEPEDEQEGEEQQEGEETPEGEQPDEQGEGEQPEEDTESEQSEDQEESEQPQEGEEQDEPEQSEQSDQPEDQAEPEQSDEPDDQESEEPEEPEQSDDQQPEARQRPPRKARGT